MAHAWRSRILPLSMAHLAIVGTLAGAIATLTLTPPAPAQTRQLSPEPSQTAVAEPTSLLSQAQTALRQERYEEAIDLWKQLALQWPDSAETSYNLGVAHHRLFQIEEAAKAYWTATILNPNHSEAHINLSLALIQLGKLDEAMTALEHVLTLPDRPSVPASIHTMAHYNRAIVLGRQGKIEESLAAVDAALEISPDFEQARELIDIIR